nr:MULTISPECIES: PIN domain-containing protein [Nocardia]
MELVELTRTDLQRMAELVRKYADFPLRAVDAAVLAVAERLGVREVATLDLRHFSAVRTCHSTPLRLLPN